MTTISDEELAKQLQASIANAPPTDLSQATDAPYSEDELAQIRGYARNGLAADQLVCIDFWAEEFRPAGHQFRPGALTQTRRVLSGEVYPDLVMEIGKCPTVLKSKIGLACAVVRAEMQIAWMRVRDRRWMPAEPMRATKDKQFTAYVRTLYKHNEQCRACREGTRQV